MQGQELIARGYKVISLPFIREYAHYAYQKCFADQCGKRYFITAYAYEPLEHPVTHEDIALSMEYVVQLYERHTHKPVNIEFFDGWDVASVERYVEWMFNSGKFDYYETWEEDHGHQDN